MPSRSNLYRWRRRHPAIDRQVAHLLADRPRVQRRGPLQHPAGYTPERARAVLARLAAGESRSPSAATPPCPA